MIGAFQAGVLAQRDLTPSVYLFDTFTGDAGTALPSHNPDIGGPWVKPTSTYFTNNILLSGSGSTSLATGVRADVVDIGTPNCFITANVVCTSAGGIWFNTNYEDGLTYGYGDSFGFGTSSGTNWYTLDGSSVGSIGSFGTRPVVACEIKIQCFDGVIKWAINDSIIATRNITYPLNTKFGIYTNTAAGQYFDFKIEQTDGTDL